MKWRLHQTNFLRAIEKNTERNKKTVCKTESLRLQNRDLYGLATRGTQFRFVGNHKRPAQIDNVGAGRFH